MVRTEPDRAGAVACVQGIDPAAEGLANGDAGAAKAAGAPPVDLAQSFRSRGVQGSIAIGNLAELLESEDELTRFTAAKVLAPWTE